MVEIRVIIICNTNILTVYKTLSQNVIKMLPTIHQGKAKIPETNKKWQVISTIYRLFKYILCRIV